MAVGSVAWPLWAGPPLAPAPLAGLSRLLWVTGSQSPGGDLKFRGLCLAGRPPRDACTREVLPARPGRTSTHHPQRPAPASEMEGGRPHLAPGTASCPPSVLPTHTPPSRSASPSRRGREAGGAGAPGAPGPCRWVGGQGSTRRRARAGASRAARPTRSSRARGLAPTCPGCR